MRTEMKIFKMCCYRRVELDESKDLILQPRKIRMECQYLKCVNDVALFQTLRNHTLAHTPQLVEAVLICSLQR
jgi:hypothetical protein